MGKIFTTIVCDPPWKFSDKLKMSDIARGAAANYPTMTISDIKQLPVKDLADPTGAVLALWVPSSLLQEGLDTMKAWGFQHKQTFVWIKNKKEIFKDAASLFMEGFSFCIRKDYRNFIKQKISTLKVSDVL